MRIFLTGATGFIGSALIPELIDAGHQVLGMARSDAGAAALVAAGAAVHRGRLEDLPSLHAGAALADGVIHCAYDHDFSKYEENRVKDSRAIDALGSALAGTDRPLVVTSATAVGSVAPGQIATEDYYVPEHFSPRVTTEHAAAALVERGVNVSVVRLSQVHDTVKQGFVTRLVQVAREKGIAAYIGDGGNRWPAAHVLDTARLYRLALEKHASGSRYHAVAEEGIAMRRIAEAIGASLRLPVVSLSADEANGHFGWLTMFAGLDMPASSALTQQRLGWRPTGPGLLEDLGKLSIGV